MSTLSPRTKPCLRTLGIASQSGQHPRPSARKGFRSETHARAAAAILRRITGEWCYAKRTSETYWIIVRTSGNKQVRG